MVWQEGIVAVHTPVSIGSGFMVAPDLLITAGHVLAPPGAPAPQPGEVIVRVNERRVVAERWIVHPRWQVDLLESGDLALIKLMAPASDVYLELELDYQPVDNATCIGVGRTNGELVEVLVALDRRVHQLGYDMYWGEGFVAPRGVSGGPFLIEGPAGKRAVGVATSVAAEGNLTVFVGLPLLPITLGYLQAQLQAGGDR